MYNLAVIIKSMIRDYMEASNLTDVVTGKVTSVDPIAISTDQTKDPIPKEFIILTDNVIEKTIDKVEHKHSYYDSDTGEGASGSSTRETDIKLNNIQCYQNGVALGYSKDNKIIINKGLAVGDKVLMIKANNAQAYIVIQKLY